MITFVLAAYNEKHDYLVSLGSLLCQTDPAWKAIVFHNGDNHALMANIGNFMDSRISFCNSKTVTGNALINWYKAVQETVTTEYVVLSSIQDYYAPDTVENIRKHSADFIYWNSLNHLYSRNAILNAYPKYRSIDFGNFATRTAILRNVDFRTFHPSMADGMIAERLIDLKVTTAKIDMVLTFHN